MEDLLRFDNALREHRLLPSAYTRWYFDGVEPGAGGAPGVCASLGSDGELTVIVLANLDEPIAERMGRQIDRDLPRWILSLAGGSSTLPGSSDRRVRP